MFYDKNFKLSWFQFCLYFVSLFFTYSSVKILFYDFYLPKPLVLFLSNNKTFVEVEFHEFVKVIIFFYK